MDTERSQLDCFWRLCLALSFLLSGMEAGVFALNRLRVRRLARAGQPSAKCSTAFWKSRKISCGRFWSATRWPTFSSSAGSLAKLHEWFAGPARLDRRRCSPAIVFLFYALFDLLPKMLFRAHPNQLCLSAAQRVPARPFCVEPAGGAGGRRRPRALLRWTGGQAFTGRLFGNREEMRAVMQESAQALTSDERAMINRVLDLQNFTVRQIAMPLAQVVTVETQTPLGDALALARERKFSRLPVWETRDGQRRIAGLLDARAAAVPRRSGFAKTRRGAHDARAVCGRRHAAGSRAAPDATRRPAAGHRAGARPATKSGIVTLEDILKVMFGEVKL